MRLEQINYFVQIVKCGSISRAAEVLFMSQPALSSTMRDFENELGVQLLVRSSKGVSPTEAGERIYQEALQIQAI